MYTTIISVENLNNIIKNSNLIIFDCRFNLLDKNLGYSEYIKSHIINSNYIDLESDLSCEVSEFSGRHPLQDISKFSNMLNSYDIDENSQIVVYDEGNSSMCSRLWWMLKLIGLKNCAVLDGGYKAWKLKNMPTNNIVPNHYKKNKMQYDYNSDYLIDTKTLKNKLEKKSICLIDARDTDRFSGKIEPLDKKAGHIPGAINLPFKDNLDENGFFKNKDELKKRFEEILKDNTNEVINMCGSGVTACHNFLAMEHCGIGLSKIYVGSWSAWSSYEDNKIEKEL